MVRRTTWILLGVLAVVAVAYGLWRRASAQKVDAEPTAAPVQLWSLTADQIETLRLVNLSSGRLLVVRRDPLAGWQMTAPRIVEADSGRIEMALGWLLAPDVRQSLEDPGDLSAFGLEPPQARLTVLLKDGASRTLEVGRIDPTGSVYYVRLPGGSAVALVSRYGVDDLLGLIEDPPYLPATPTPSAAPQATAMP